MRTGEAARFACLFCCLLSCDVWPRRSLRERLLDRLDRRLQLCRGFRVATRLRIHESLGRPADQAHFGVSIRARRSGEPVEKRLKRRLGFTAREPFLGSASQVPDSPGNLTEVI